MLALIQAQDAFATDRLPGPVSFWFLCMLIAVGFVATIVWLVNHLRPKGPLR